MLHIIFSVLCRVWIPLKVLQSVALWLVWKTAPDNQSLALPAAIFGAHLALGNWWNGGHL
jgi:benzodiazapine receptor